jgi:futalosine hydrolase
MYIQLIAATNLEINTTAHWLQTTNGTADANKVEVLITGVGSCATSHALTRNMLKRTPEMVIQAGIGGSFRKEYAPGSVVFIDEEVFADLGAWKDEGFEDIFDMGFADRNEMPYTNGMLVNPSTERWTKYSLSFVRGATINCISSTDQHVNAIQKKYDPVIESMEGAALHYVCIKENIPFIQLRAVSNYTGDRNKNQWKMKEAIAALNETLIRILTNEMI